MAVSGTPPVTTFSTTVYGREGVTANQSPEAAVAKAAARLPMEEGATYTIDASGTIDRGHHRKVDPDDLVQDGSGRTRLQVNVKRPDGTIDALNYRPGMQLKTGTGDGQYPAGSEISTSFIEGQRARDLRDNKGQFNVEIKKQSALAPTIPAADTVEQPKTTTPAATPPAATVSSPAAEQERRTGLKDPALAQTGDGTITSSSGYKFVPDGANSLTLTTPHGESSKFDFKNNQIVESDGTTIKFTNGMKDGIYTLPDSTFLRFNRAENGDITGYQIQSGENLITAKVNAEAGTVGFEQNASTEEGKKAARDFRLQAAHDALQEGPNRRLEFGLVGFGEEAEQRLGDKGADKKVGWYAYEAGQGIGWVGSKEVDGAQANTIDRRTADYTAPSLRPVVGTPAYEDVLKNQAVNQEGVTKALLENDPRVTSLPADLRAKYASLYMTQNNQVANDLLKINEAAQNDPALKELLGGWGQYFPSGTDALLAYRQMLAYFFQQLAGLNLQPQTVFPA